MIWMYNLIIGKNQVIYLYRYRIFFKYMYVWRMTHLSYVHTTYYVAYLIIKETIQFW